jgi:hypothetical protein
MLVRETNEWKIAAEQYDTSPIESAAVFALLPGRGGAFALAGTPWTAVAQVPAAARQSPGAKVDWKVRATRDEDSIYLRYEAVKALPPPGTEIHKADKSTTADTGVPSVPLLNLKVTGAQGGAGSQEYNVRLGAVVQTRATADTSTGAYHNRYFVQYSLSIDVVRPGGIVGLFDSHTGERFARLIGIDASSITVRLPLRALSAAAPARVTVEDTNRPGGFPPAVIDVFAKPIKRSTTKER